MACRSSGAVPCAAISPEEKWTAANGSRSESHSASSTPDSPAPAAPVPASRSPTRDTARTGSRRSPYRARSIRRCSQTRAGLKQKATMMLATTATPKLTRLRTIRSSRATRPA